LVADLGDGRHRQGPDVGTLDEHRPVGVLRLVHRRVRYP
jgi:hypothetical protein